ncbi:MAG: AraC family transcriptional regulator [Pleomorphochaeta sp.]
MNCQEVINYIEYFKLQEGFNETIVKGVKIFKNDYSLKRQLLDYNPGILIVLNGTKHGYIKNTHFEYSRDYYLVLPTHLQFECEAVATKENPVFGLHIELDIEILQNMILKMDNITPPVVNVNTFKANPLKITKEIEDASKRLLESLKSINTAKILAPLIVNEIFYYVLNGENIDILYSLCINGSEYDRLAKALKIIHTNYYNHISVDELAKECYMSPSNFYKTFKNVTGETPIQYLKKIRLKKAKDMLVYNNKKAYEVALSVGYESNSQFSREFKRLYGKSPAAYKLD